MSLYESPSFNFSEPSFVKAVPPATPSKSNPTDRLADALSGLFAIRKSEAVRRGLNSVIIFTGKLAGPAETLYATISERFRSLGYTPMLERYQHEDIVVAVPGLRRAGMWNSPWWLHLGLLLLTIVSTIASGAQIGGIPIPRVIRAINTGHWDIVGQVVRVGAPFALTLLLILGVHEMGHYFAARRHKVAVTLPFFIPLPIIGLVGTLGAVIFIKSSLNNRKALFDVGISGPLAGFVVALLAFPIGLLLPTFGDAGSFRGLGIPPLLNWVGHAVVGSQVNLSLAVIEHPVALAAWFGVLLTVLNLLPIGQLDGGHVVYTLFGRASWLIALTTFGVLIYVGLTTASTMFMFYAVLALFTGLRHPPPADDITPLNPARYVIGIGTIVLFFLIATPTPFLIQGGF
ncbi:MAG: site-2 protease family protein [Aggregatilineales bacterium]